MSHLTASAVTFEALDAQELRDAICVHDAPEELRDALYSALEGQGKGLRPTILREAARHGPEAHGPALDRAVAAVEVVHTATMMHDDILDRGELRRGHASAAACHGSHKAATLGVWLLGSAVWLFIDCGPEAVRYASRSIAHMFAGQASEVSDLFNLDRTPDRCIEAAAGKTAALFQLSAWLGARLTRAPSSSVAALERFGLEFGVAYQIADDILDLCADASASGKHPGKDIRMGVYTLPVIYALQAQPELRGALAKNLEPDAVADVLVAIGETDGIERALSDCEMRVEAALEAVTGLTDRRRLAALAEYPLARCREVLDR